MRLAPVHAIAFGTWVVESPSASGAGGVDGLSTIAVQADSSTHAHVSPKRWIGCILEESVRLSPILHDARAIFCAAVTSSRMLACVRVFAAAARSSDARVARGGGYLAAVNRFSPFVSGTSGSQQCRRPPVVDSIARSTGLSRCGARAGRRSPPPTTKPVLGAE
jgi:hypothetical protein